MGRSQPKKLRRGTSNAGYPTLAAVRLDRRTFLAGLSAATLGACFHGSDDDDDLLDGALPPPDAGPDSGPEIPDSGYISDGVPPPPDAGSDAEPPDAIEDDALPDDADSDDDAGA